jgi:hypothetical protein
MKESYENSKELDKVEIIEFLMNRSEGIWGELCIGELEYLSFADSMFREALQGLRTIKGEDNYPKWINEYSRWFYEALTGESIITDYKLGKTINEITDAKKNLARLRINPDEFYKNNSKEFNSFLKKLYANYPEKIFDR